MTNPDTLVLSKVTVVDTRDGSLAPDMDVTVIGERISTITPTGTGPGQPVDGLVDARGMYVVPGFLDMHAHPFELKDPTGSFELMLATGITGFRQMSGSPMLLEQRASGTLPMPRESPALLAMPGSVLTPFNAATLGAAVRTVTARHAAGADFMANRGVSPLSAGCSVMVRRPPVPSAISRAPVAGSGWTDGDAGPRSTWCWPAVRDGSR